MFAPASREDPLKVHP